MKSPYSIEDVLLQSPQLIVYRVVDQHGHSFALTRLLFNEREQGKLAAGGFENALEALKELDHSCLRRALDGGLDEIDGAPWIVTQLWEGDPVKARHEAGNFDYEGKARLETQARNLIESLGGYAGALSFNPSEVIDTKASDGSIVETFSMDLREWLLGWIRSDELFFERNPELGLARLLGTLPVAASVVAPAVTQALPTAPLAPQVPLSSASSGSPVGLIAILTLLAGGIGAGAWWAMKDKDELVKVAKIEAAAAIVKKKPLSDKRKAPAQKSSFKAKPTQVAQVAKAEPPKLESKPKLQARPPASEIEEVNAGHPKKIKSLVGHWVALEGKISRRNKKGHWILTNTLEDGESMKIVYEGEESEIGEVAGRDLIATGIITSARSLKVVSKDDLEFLDEERVKVEFYTIKDEEGIKDLEGEKITLKATVLRTEASSSEKTIYLIFTDEKPYLAAAISNKPEEHGIDMDYFDSLVGKEVSVTGIAEAESRDRRFIFRINGKDDLKVE